MQKIAAYSITVCDRPLMEYHIYCLQVDEMAFFLQRMDSMNSGSEWHEMTYGAKGWQTAGEHSFLDFTKHEAINTILNRISKL